MWHFDISTIPLAVVVVVVHMPFLQLNHPTNPVLSLKLYEQAILYRIHYFLRLSFPLLESVALLVLLSLVELNA
jgi:hypothetical protein